MPELEEIRLVAEQTSSRFNEALEWLVKDGWVPHGMPTILSEEETGTYDENRFFQLMVKPKKD